MVRGRHPNQHRNADGNDKPQDGFHPQLVSMWWPKIGGKFGSFKFAPAR
jgi:hypothetical protein